jgi:hypothetical protein
MERIGAVVQGIPWADFPKRPHMSVKLMLAVHGELQKAPRLKDAYARLAANRDNRDWFPALDELEEAKAVACLATALWHPHIDVKIRSARALGRLRDTRSGEYLLQMARSFAVLVGGSEDATLHGIFQHALANALNRIAGTAVRLKEGQDAEGLLAGLPVWNEALAQRREALGESSGAP